MVDNDNLILDKNLRDKLANRIDILDKVKKIVTIPNTDLLTQKQVADYYEVGYSAIRDLLKHNKEEIEADGSKLVSRDCFSKAVNCPSKNNRGTVTFTFHNGEELTIPNNGLRVFSKRAVLRIGMLLTKSEVARRLRTALLDIATGEVPVVTTVQDALTDMIDDQKKNLIGVVSSLVSGDTESAIRGMSDLCMSDQKHMRRMQDQVNKLKPSANAYDRICDSENTRSMKDAAKILNYGRNTLFSMLRNDGYLMFDNTPYQKYVNQGLFKERLRYANNGQIYPVTLMTDKGITYFKKLYSGKAVNA